MRRSTSLSCLLLVLAAAGASAQSIPEISFCPAGVQADGLVDWSKFPVAPNVPFGQQGSVTAALPVTGVPNLTATVTVQGYVSNPSNSLYNALNSTDLFVSTVGGTPVVVTFSKPVRGFSVVFRNYGRSSHGFHMMANDVNGNTTSVTPPPPAQVDAEGYEFSNDEIAAAPLQIRSTAANLVSLAFGFDGDVNENFAFELINLRVESGSSADLSQQVPLAGLEAWFRSDKTGVAVSYPGQAPSSWPDQSGNGHDAAVPAGATGPSLTLDGAHCTPVLSFNGAQKFNFNLPINGWTGMTTFVVAQSYADGTGSSNATLFWDENAPWGETFVSPFQTSVWYRFGTGQPGNQPNYSRPTDIGGNFSITTTIHNANTDSLYVDGVLAQQVPYRYAPIQGTITSAAIGSGYRGSGFTGNIGEILVYDRALTHTERERVEQYLRAKFGTM